MSASSHAAASNDMRDGVAANRPLALLLLLAVACLAGACVKLPRAASLASAQRAQQFLAVVPVNINTASAAELEKLPGVGKALAARIVEYRQEQGPFRRAEHLMMVRGISDRRFRAMRAMITVE